MHSGMDKSNELLIYASQVVDAHVLDMLREKLPDVVEVPGLLGMKLSPAIKGVHVLICPSDSEVSKVIAMTGARHDLKSVDPVLECLGIDTCLELQEHDSAGDPLHAN